MIITGRGVTTCDVNRIFLDESVGIKGGLGSGTGCGLGGVGIKGGLGSGTGCGLGGVGIKGGLGSGTGCGLGGVGIKDDLGSETIVEDEVVFRTNHLFNKSIDLPSKQKPDTIFNSFKVLDLSKGIRSPCLYRLYEFRRVFDGSKLQLRRYFDRQSLIVKDLSKT